MRFLAVSYNRYLVVYLYLHLLKLNYFVKLSIYLNLYDCANCFTFIVGSEVKEIANSPRPSGSASTSPVKNTGLFETSKDDVVTPTSESSTEIVNTSDNSNETTNVDEHNETESDNKEVVDTSKECVDGQKDTRLADAEFDQGNSADDSIESSVTQEKVSSCQLLIFMSRLKF